MPFLVLLLLSALALAAADTAGPATALLARRCAGCHNAKARTGGLDLTSRDGAVRGGLERILGRVNAGTMPPDGKLDDADRALLAEWVKAGAPWTREPWWSLGPLRPGTGSIDAQIAAALRAKGLSPAPEADRRTLLRRLTFDLTGLPPTPGEIDAFSADTSPGAYERQVDRLLASPRYGERWARHWLDAVRFSESEGFERDLPRDHAWRYRDYVINAWNSDKPYTDFVREQIAGDILRPDDPSAIAATGLLVLGPTDAVGLTSAVARERDAVRQEQLEEMAGTVAQTFLGLTVNCARCHDHKFDPIPQRDYYRFQAAFAGVWQPFTDPDSTELLPGGRLLLAAERTAREAMDARLGELDRRIATLHRRQHGWPGPAPIGHWTFDVDAFDHIGGLAAKSPAEARYENGHLEAAKSVSISSASIRKEVREKTLEAWVTVRQPLKDHVSVFQIMNQSGYRGAAADGIQFAGGTNRQWRNLSTASFRTEDVKGEKEETAPEGQVHIAITYATDGTIRIFRNGRPYGSPYRPDAGPSGELQTYAAGDAIVRFSATSALALNEARLYDVALSPEQVAASYGGGPLPSLAPKDTPLFAERERLRKEAESMPAPAQAFAAMPREPGVVHVLARGDVARPGEAVAAAGLSSLPGAELGLTPDAPDSERRKRLAVWLTGPAAPLLARVIVNRVWAGHFGVGFVENPNDFGANGGLPSHPGLLDTLAVTLVDSGWSLKQLHRRIVLSGTYRQSSRYLAAAATADAGNRLLWRYPARRLEGEAVRDAMLAVSGVLRNNLGGPSFQPFEVTKPGGSYVRYVLKDGSEPALQRRTIYRMNVNTGGDPLLESLDCPVPAVKTPRRPVTTTALQALSLMNSAQTVRLADAFAQRLEREIADPAARRTRAFRLALGRPPTAAELASAEPLTLQELCWGLFNSSEFLYVE